jgi:hypothetical protein
MTAALTADMAWPSVLQSDRQVEEIGIREAMLRSMHPEYGEFNGIPQMRGACRDMD